MNVHLSFKERFFWLRCFLPVVFSHKPLCRRFRQDVVSWGKIDVCRSCVLLYSGFLLALTIVLSCPVSYGAWKAALFGVLLAVAGVSFPWWYGRFYRRVRDVLRFLLGCLLAVPVGFWKSGYIREAGVFLLVLLAMRLGYAAFHKDLNSRACSGCEELGRSGICSGFMKKAQCMIRYEEGIKEILSG